MKTLDQGALLTREDLAFRIFNCRWRTISRDLKVLAERGVVLPLRSQQKDAGRAMTHRVQVVEMYLKRQTFTQIRQRMRHSLLSIANYVITFALVVAHTRDEHTVEEITFLMQISAGLVCQYQERIEEMIATLKARGFRPSQLEAEEQSTQGQKRGTGHETQAIRPPTPSGQDLARSHAQFHSP